MVYAAIHEFGGKIEMPARPFLKLTEAEEAKIARKLLEYLAGRLQG